MKKIIFSLLCITVFLSSCKHELSYELIEGEWKVTNLNDNDFRNDLSTSTLNETKQVVLSTTFSFNKDKTYTETVDDNPYMVYKNIGRYEIDNNNNLLTTYVERHQQKDEKDMWYDIDDEMFLYSTKFEITKVNPKEIIAEQKINNKRLIHTWTKR